MWAGGVFSVGPFSLVGGEVRGREGITVKYENREGRGMPVGSLTQVHTLSLADSVLCVCDCVPWSHPVCVQLCSQSMGRREHGPSLFQSPDPRPRLTPCHRRRC